MSRGRPTDAPEPEDIISATLRRLIEAGPIHATFGAKQILADLAGHRIVLTYQPPAAQRCPNHPSIEPPCPLCRT